MGPELFYQKIVYYSYFAFISRGRRIVEQERKFNFLKEVKHKEWISAFPLGATSRIFLKIVCFPPKSYGIILFDDKNCFLFSAQF